MPAPGTSVCVDLNVIAGYFATSRKCGLRTSLSRIWTRLLNVVASMVASMDVFAGSDGSKTTVPLAFSNWPRTVEIPKCFTENCAAVWLGSICQVCGSAKQNDDKAAITTARMTVLELVLILIMKSALSLRVRELFVTHLRKASESPPSTGMMWPVVFALCSLSNQTIACAQSCGMMGRFVS